MKYITIPKDLIYRTDYGSRRTILYSYLYVCRGLDNVVRFCIKDLIKWCCLTPDRHKNKINDQYINGLELLSKNNYFSSYINFSRNKDISKFYSISINEDKFNALEQYGIIYLDEIEKIIHFKDYIHDKKTTHRISSSSLLLVLAYIRSNIYKNNSKNIDNKQPECCYRLYSTISNDIGITEQCISKCVNILFKLELINYKESPRYQDKNGNWHTNVKVFANTRRFIRDDNGNYVLDSKYDSNKEINKQIKILSERKVNNDK